MGMISIQDQTLVLRAKNGMIEKYNMDDIINEIEKAYELIDDINNQYDNLTESNNSLSFDNKEVMEVMFLLSCDNDLMDIVNSADNIIVNKHTKEKFKVFIEDYINNMVLVYLNKVKGLLK